MIEVLRLSVRQVASGWRLLLVVLLGALPAVVATVANLAGGGLNYDEATDALYDGLMVGAVLPIVTMALATAAFGNELEDRTLSYLVLKPVPRWLIALPKLLSSIAVAGPVLIASAAIAAVYTSGGGLRAAIAVGVAILAGVVAYASIFTWAGLATRNALGFALLYVFLWEGLVGTFLSGVRYLSIRAYVLAIMHGIDEPSFQVLDGRVIELPAAAGGAAAVTLAFFWLTVRRLRTMDVP